jgi:hypothetical protein
VTPALIILAALIAYANRPRPTPRPWGAWIVIVEPSLYRVEETFVCGPYQTRREAMREARWQVKRHPWGEARIVSSGVTATCAGRTIWPAHDLFS